MAARAARRSARGVLTELGLEDIAVVGIAKGPDRDAGRERFFMPGRHRSRSSRAIRCSISQRLRDEAHRFAIGTHRRGGLATSRARHSTRFLASAPAASAPPAASFR